jgi:hypothetical protein
VVDVQVSGSTHYGLSYRISRCDHKRDGDDVMEDKIQESTVPSPGAHRTVNNLVIREIKCQ